MVPHQYSRMTLLPTATANLPKPRDESLPVFVIRENRLLPPPFPRAMGGKPPPEYLNRNGLAMLSFYPQQPQKNEKMLGCGDRPEWHGIKLLSYSVRGGGFRRTRPLILLHIGRISGGFLLPSALAARGVWG